MNIKVKNDILDYIKNFKYVMEEKHIKYSKRQMSNG